jgi:hypothetical protein
MWCLRLAASNRQSVDNGATALALSTRRTIATVSASTTGSPAHRRIAESPEGIPVPSQRERTVRSALLEQEFGSAATSRSWGGDAVAPSGNFPLPLCVAPRPGTAELDSAFASLRLSQG